MILKLVIFFFASFLLGYLAGELFVKRGRSRKSNPAKMPEGDIHIVKTTSKQETYN